MSDTWVLWNVESGNVVDGTSDPARAGRLWRLTVRDQALKLSPDIDCEGDCCPPSECRFGLTGGPSASDPDEYCVCGDPGDCNEAH